MGYVLGIPGILYGHLLKLLRKITVNIVLCLKVKIMQFGFSLVRSMFRLKRF